MAGLLSAGGELGNRAARRGLGHLSAGVRVHLGIQHQHVYVHPRAENVIESSKADVIGPSVAAHEPNALADQPIGDRDEIARLAARETGNQALDLGDALALRCDAGLSGLVRLEDLRYEAFAYLTRKPAKQFPRVVNPLVEREPHPSPNSALSSNREFDHAGPRPSAFEV